MKLLTLFLLPYALFAQSHESDAAYAAKVGDITTLKILVEKLGVSPNALSKKQPLIFYSKNAKVARYLSEKGAALRGPDGRTLLMLSAGSGDKKMFALSFNEKDITARDNQGWTALHYLAGGSGKMDLARKLVRGGADVNALDAERWTPLMLAAQKGNHALADYLIKRGAKTGLKNKDRQSALDLVLEAEAFAVKKKAFEKTVQILKRGTAK